jgi:hypothetical protein
MSYSSATNGQRTHVYEVFDCYGSQLAFSLNEKKGNSANSASIHLTRLGHV